MQNSIDFSKLSPKALKTYNNIFSSAKEEFSSKGYTNTTISSIAKHANVSVGCIYKYFNNKDELYEFIITKEQANIKQILRNAISSCNNREDKELAGLKSWLTYVKDNPGIYKLIWESLFINMKAFMSYYQSFSDSYKYALTKDKDQLTSEDYETISYMLIGISNFLGINLMFKENISEQEVDYIASSAIKILRNGLFR